MTSYLRSGVIILFFFSTQTISAQNLSETDPVLYNGRIYTYHLHPGIKGHQFFSDQVFKTGWLKIRGIVFDGQNINYDVFHQQLILKYTTSEGVSRQIIISDAWLEAFGYDDIYFEVSGPDSRIYQVLGKKPCRVLYQWSKTLDLSRVYGARNYVFSNSKKQMFLEINDTMLTFSGNKSFTTIYRTIYGRESGDTVRNYLNEKRINTRKADDSRIEDLLSLCKSIVKPLTEKKAESEKKMNIQYGIIPGSGTSIFYKSGSPDTLRILESVSDSISFRTRIDRLLQGTGLIAADWNHDIVIIPPEVHITSLPDYQRIVSVDSPGSPEKKLTETEAKYLTGRSPDITQLITVGRQGANTSGTRARILCRIHDQETGEPLMSVPLYIQETKTGAVSDINGFINIALSPGSYNAEVVYLGYEARKFILRVLSDGAFTLMLQKAAIKLQDVVISASAQSSMNIKDAGLENISVRNLKSLPVLMGEQDVLKASVTLPPWAVKCFLLPCLVVISNTDASLPPYLTGMKPL